VGPTALRTSQNARSYRFEPAGGSTGSDMGEVLKVADRGCGGCESLEKMKHLKATSSSINEIRADMMRRETNYRRSMCSKVTNLQLVDLGFLPTMHPPLPFLFSF
jgi:hypothetical protein